MSSRQRRPPSQGRSAGIRQQQHQRSQAPACNWNMERSRGSTCPTGRRPGKRAWSAPLARPSLIQATPGRRGWPGSFLLLLLFFFHLLPSHPGERRGVPKAEDLTPHPRPLTAKNSISSSRGPRGSGRRGTLAEQPHPPFPPSPSVRPRPAETPPSDDDDDRDAHGGSGRPPGNRESRRPGGPRRTLGSPFVQAGRWRLRGPSALRGPRGASLQAGHAVPGATGKARRPPRSLPFRRVRSEEAEGREWSQGFRLGVLAAPRADLSGYDHHTSDHSDGGRKGLGTC